MEGATMPSATTVCSTEDGTGRSTVLVHLTVPAEFGCRGAEASGEFTAWVPVAMQRQPDGTFSLTLRLELGRDWHYRFRLDGETWINDPCADTYILCPDCGAVSVLAT
jgi:hypothetical protein